MDQEGTSHTAETTAKKNLARICFHLNTLTMSCRVFCWRWSAHLASPMCFCSCCRLRLRERRNASFAGIDHQSGRSHPVAGTRAWSERLAPQMGRLNLDYPVLPASRRSRHKPPESGYLGAEYRRLDEHLTNRSPSCQVRNVNEPLAIQRDDAGSIHQLCRQARTKAPLAIDQ